MYLNIHLFKLYTFKLIDNILDIYLISQSGNFSVLCFKSKENYLLIEVDRRYTFTLNNFAKQFFQIKILNGHLGYGLLKI